MRYKALHMRYSTIHPLKYWNYKRYKRYKRYTVKEKYVKFLTYVTLVTHVTHDKILWNTEYTYVTLL